MQISSETPLEGAPLIRPSSTDHPLYDQVVEACRTVYDPEIPVNIFDLGLVYIERTRVKRAVDAAVLAGVVELPNEEQAFIRAIDYQCFKHQFTARSQ